MRKKHHKKKKENQLLYSNKIWIFFNFFIPLKLRFLFQYKKLVLKSFSFMLRGENLNRLYIKQESLV